MSQKTFSITTGLFFLVIALLHLMRSVEGWEAQIGGFEVPLWLSYAALVVAAYLSYQGFKLSRKSL